MQREELFARQEEIDTTEEVTIDTEKYLLFSTGGILFGVKAEHVVEIITTFSIREVPLVPSFISGIINLRGQILPVVDIRKYLNQETAEGSCVIILSMEDTTIGAIVDGVEKMIDIAVGTIQSMPAGKHQDLARGMCSLTDGKTMIEFDALQLLQKA